MVRARGGLQNAPHGGSSAALRALVAGRALAFGIALSIAGFLELWLARQSAERADRRVHAGQLPLPLHADEAAHLVVHHGRRDSRAPCRR